MINGKEEFINAHRQLEEEIKKVGRDEAGIFIDGAFNPEAYFDTSPKVLWILKEAYGDPISYPELLVRKYDEFYANLICGVSRNTWKPISIISDCILRGCEEYNSGGDSSQEKAAFEESLNKIAFININKDSSYTGGRSINSNIQEAGSHYEKLLKKQIELLHPDIIICGNTFQFLREIYNRPEVIKEVQGEKYVDHYRIGKQIFLDPYHPGYTAYATCVSPGSSQQR